MDTERKHPRPDRPSRTESAAAPRNARDAANDDATTAPVSGGGMSGTGAPSRSRSHSGTSTTPGAGPNPTASPSPGKRR